MEKRKTFRLSGRYFQMIPQVLRKTFPLFSIKITTGISFSDQRESMILLYSDMTVRPVDRIFNVYNNASYYSVHDLTMIFKFFNRRGTALSMRNSTRCLSLSKPALVVRGRDGYSLDEEGFILAEEK